MAETKRDEWRRAQSLKEKNQKLSETKQSVLEKNNLAKSKAETILERLRSIEDSA